MDKKRLYWNGCSFLYPDMSFEKGYITSEKSPLSKLFCNISSEETDDSYLASIIGSNNEFIFRRTIIDCSKNNFDFVLIGWSHPERSLTLDYSILDIDYEKLKEDSERNFVGNSDGKIYGYQNILPSSAEDNKFFLKFEPKGTDDTILYTICLHHFLKQKNIPHLFLNMGKLNSDVLESRKSWLKDIDPKNYLSDNVDDDILQKMKFSFIEYYVKKINKKFLKDSDIHEYNKLNGSIEEYERGGWIIDMGGHLGRMGYDDLFDKIYNHIINNNLV